jgi:sugar phosphate isomerase/epimerase
MPSSRRSFLCQSAATTLAIAGWTLGGQRAAAIDPFDRPQAGPLKLSLAAYSFRQELTRRGDEPAAMTLFDLVDFCRRQQLPGVELTSYYFPADFDRGYLRRLARHCHVQGVTISGGAIRNDFCVAPEKREAELAHVRKWIDAYAELGAPVIRIFAGSPPAGTTREEATERCVEACELACQYAASRGVMLALENHGGITDTAESMLRIVRAVQSPWFGVNFDSGNFKSTDDPYAELAQIAPYAINAQVKVEIWSGGKKIPADLARVVEILKAAGYGGWVTFEYEAKSPAREAIPGHLQNLRQLIS